VICHRTPLSIVSISTGSTPRASLVRGPGGSPVWHSHLMTRTIETPSTAHMAKVLASPDNRLRAITRDSQLVGTIASYVSEGATEVTYWTDRADWGQGIATRALSLLLEEIPVRPIRARAVSDNAGLYESFRRRASIRSVPRSPSRRVGASRSRRPFSSCLNKRKRNCAKTALLRVSNYM
jgi:hypothetical protein